MTNSTILTNERIKLLIVSFVSIIISFIVLFNTNGYPEYTLLFMLPFLNGLLMLIFPAMWKYKKNHIGLTIFNLVLWVRYTFSPLIQSMTIRATTLHKAASERGFKIGLLIMILELLFSFIVVQIFAKRIYIKMKGETILFNPLKSRIVLFVFILIGIGIILIFPEILSRYNFFVITEQIEKANVSLPFSDILLILTDLILVIIPIILLDILKKKHNLHPNFRYVFLSILSVLPTMMIFKGNSRLSVLIPAIVWMIILLKLYPKYRKIIISTLLSLSVIVFISITLYKQFSYTVGDESISEPINLQTISHNLNIYVSGPNNMGLAVDLENTYGHNIDFITMKNDFIDNVAFLSRYSNSSNTSTAWFNQMIYGSSISVDQIIPMSGQGFLYFGFIFSPIFLVITLILMMIIDNKIFYDNRIEFEYVYIYIVIHMAMAMMFSTISIYPLFTNLLLPVLLIFKANRMFIIKKITSVA